MVNGVPVAVREGIGGPFRPGGLAGAPGGQGNGRTPLRSPITVRVRPGGHDRGPVMAQREAPRPRADHPGTDPWLSFD